MTSTKASLNKRRLWIGISISGIAAILPIVFVLTMYLVAMNTGLPGRRGGPQDAFRHTFTSSIVGKFLGPAVVHLVTLICERNSNSPYDRMDIHNNTLGALIGDSSGLSVLELYGRILTEVDSAQVETFEPGKIMHLAPEKWSNGF